MEDYTEGYIDIDYKPQMDWARLEPRQSPASVKPMPKEVLVRQSAACSTLLGRAEECTMILPLATLRAQRPVPLMRADISACNQLV